MRRLCAHFALIVLAGGVAAAPARAASDPDDTCPPAEAFGLIARANLYRTERGLAPLQPDLRLFRAAERLALDLARHGRIGHVASDGSTVGVRVAATGYDRSLAAENVAAGQLAPAEVVIAWAGSPGHQRNLALPHARHVGAAHVTGLPACRGCAPDYWVLVMAVPRGPASPMPVECPPPETARR
jgi:uncharacterized protein YkwD